MSSFIVNSNLSIAKKQITFRVRIYNVFGKLKDEFSIRAFGKCEFIGESDVIAKSIINEVYPKKSSWQNMDEDSFKIKLTNGNNCLIYPPNGIPKGGRKKGSKDSYKRTRINKKPIEQPNTEVIEQPEIITENTEVLENEIQS